MDSEKKILFISPHFDDAVLSCRAHLATYPGSHVATVFSGAPDERVQSGSWDRLSGFSTGHDATRFRHFEDSEALALVGATQHELGFLEGQYRTTDRIHEDRSIRGLPVQAIAHSIGKLIDGLQPTYCAFPIGIFHDDHLLARNSARTALLARPWCQALAYRELPYALERERATEAQFEWLCARDPFPAPTTSAAAIKRQAVACYRSQIELVSQLFGSHWEHIFDEDAEAIRRIEPGWQERALVSSHRDETSYRIGA